MLAAGEIAFSCGTGITINRQLSYTPASGFPAANSNLAGTLLNVRAVQAIFDDANYPGQGSRVHPYQSDTLGPIFWDYPDGPWDPERNVREFLAALPDWRRCGLLAFTVNLQGGGPPDGNYGDRVSLQPHLRISKDVRVARFISAVATHFWRSVTVSVVEAERSGMYPYLSRRSSGRARHSRCIGGGR